MSPFIVHFVLLAKRLKQAVLSLDKLSEKKKAVMQNQAIYYERGTERKNECNHLTYA